MSDQLIIQSHKGPYSVFFDDCLLSDPSRLSAGECLFLIDVQVARLYEKQLEPLLIGNRTILIEATEENKSIEKIIPLIENLVAAKVRREHMLVAIGGGVIQDITCFIASTLLRGLHWRFVPTTLLSQADSCIGSKSSINLRGAKNILGTFNPPDEIFINTGFLDTLAGQDVRSGLGEILKVHAIDGAQSFDRLAADFDALIVDRKLLMHYIKQALLIKQRYIEQDEFDRGVRNIFNYGHSFGHAIESATRYGVPHGIAVTMGMDMANFIAARRNMLPQQHFDRMHFVLRKNYMAFSGTHIPLDALLSALMKDKKNTSTMLGLIFPLGADAAIQRVSMAPDDRFRDDCKAFIDQIANEHNR